MATATELFSSKGYQATSVRDIAAAMDMTVSNIYHYFGSKEGLLRAVLEHYSKVLLDQLRDAVSQDLEPVERFRLLLSTHLRVAGTRPRENKIFLLDDERLSPEGREDSRAVQREVMSIYINELRNLDRHGLLRDQQLRIQAFNIFGIINWHMRWYRPQGSLTLDETIDGICDFILLGMIKRSDG
ncbi:MAG: TetR/AcrR family transcriptional regulator [Desulfarculaceae bacterium]|nr:TetR/AcrR family transcriptional regulator [Desulfarculaceae bacterium]MCF8071153.1 TetR/AcrR family transcriptional regulator [Desulfarculaceae bacterium]MCF8101244.1 TetR/AcrR family transcriptional regulator [Desulfarculaceae bacterium]MCF8115207.1 TetR/AcrR family transcriptional regulator [Desulfarculaceae bacterium]